MCVWLSVSETIVEKWTILINLWMWSGALVAHKTAMQEDLGSILTQTQMALMDLSSPFFQTTT
jgi:hypothetical protein